MRLNVIAAYALDRHYIERKGSVALSRLRYKAYVIENRRDSASNSDDPEDADAGMCVCECVHMYMYVWVLRMRVTSDGSEGFS